MKNTFIPLIVLCSAFIFCACSKDDPEPTPKPATDLLETITEGYWQDLFELIYDDAEGNPQSVPLNRYPMAFISDPINFNLHGFYVCPDRTIRRFHGGYYLTNGELVPDYHVDSTYMIHALPDLSGIELEAIKEDSRRNYLIGMKFQPTQMSKDKIIFEQPIRKEYQAEFQEEFPRVYKIRITWLRLTKTDHLRDTPPDWALTTDPEGHIVVKPY